MTETTELLPCPFCGGEATVERIGRRGFFYVACNTAYCCDFGKFDTEAEAIAEWNTRATHGTLTAEQVREAIFRCGVWDEDNAMYYVSRTDMQAIADELNAELENDCESRWHELFGSPEKAAMTMAGKCCDCCECVIADECNIEECLLSINDDEAEAKLLEWLRGKAVK